jgi:hypothetical protein
LITCRKLANKASPPNGQEKAPIPGLSYFLVITHRWEYNQRPFFNTIAIPSLDAPINSRMLLSEKLIISISMFPPE